MKTRTSTRKETAQELTVKKLKTGDRKHPERIATPASDKGTSATWINILYLGLSQTHLSVDLEALSGVGGLSAHSRPVLTVFVGSTRKSEIIGQLVAQPSKASYQRPQNSVRFEASKDASSELHPTIFVDFDLYDAGSFASTAPLRDYEGKALQNTQYALDQSTFGPNATEARRTISSLLCSRVLGPFADSICYFISDLGSQDIIHRLAEQARCIEASSDLSHVLLPRVFIVYEVVEADYDCKAAENNMRRQLCNRLESFGEDDPEGCINRHFKGISVMSILLSSSIEEKAIAINRRLQATKQDTLAAKAGYLFRRAHLECLTGKLLAHFCSKPRVSFSFVEATRPEGFSCKDFYYHLGQAMEILPKRIMWMRPFLCPLVSSAMSVACYPPGSHEFPALLLYERLFEGCILRALSTHKVEGEHLQPYIQDKFAKCLKESFEKTLPIVPQNYKTEANQLDTMQVFLEKRQAPSFNANITALHSHNLKRLTSYFQHNALRTTRTCLSCLLRTPEKMLVCGHALCDVCVRNLGKSPSEAKLSTVLSSCPLCGLAHNDTPFRHIPPTAGIRVLCLDGGGVKGIIPLMFLQHLQKKLRFLETPLTEYFDFVCGTSAGGLIAIGIFLMEWSIENCVTTFEGLAADTFGKTVRCRFLRGLQLFLGYLRDGQYSSSPIARAFKPHSRENMKMFNPLVNETKVAVVAVTAQDNPRPALFTNYNGGIRSETSAYSLIRAKSYNKEVSISEAARCTSAAPWFFPAVVLDGIGSFQDGALQHNNPVKLAQREVRVLWPTKPTADFTLSLGTGWVDPLFQSLSRTGPKRFLYRLISNSLESMDGEIIAKDYRQDLDPRQEEKYHRINVRVPRPEPSLDDVSKMEQLKAHALAEIEIPSTLNSAVDLMLASLFYFELDCLPKWHIRSGKEGWSCSGQILCRLVLPPSGRRALHEQLRTSNAKFLKDGNFVADGVDKLKGVSRSHQEVPYFRRPITFTVGSLDESIGITLHNWVSRPRTISGLPKSANELIKAQMLHAPFGRSDCAQVEKHLPQVPQEHVQVTLDPTRATRKRKREMKILEN